MSYIYIPPRRETRTLSHLKETPSSHIKETLSPINMTSSFRANKLEKSVRKKTETNDSLSESDEEEIKNYEQKEKFYLRIVNKQEDPNQIHENHRIEYVGIVSFVFKL